DLGVTNLAAAPTVYRSLRSATTPAPAGIALRRASSAGEPLNPDVVQWGAEVLGSEIHDTYGQTELGMSIVNGWHPEIAAEVRHGSMGRAMPGWAATVLKDDADEVA